jgi:sn-glycerol 3-phosphate transport system permease protein
MVENKPYRTVLTHGVLILGIAVVIFPIYITLVASTHERKDIASSVQPWFGDQLIENYTIVLTTGKKTAGGVPVGKMMVNSLIMAVAILAMLPPVFVVLVMQRLFVKGLVETEK